jgi:hypothetical protein
MDAVKDKIKEQDEKLAELSKHEDCWADFEKDNKERYANPENFKEVPLPPTPSISQDEIARQKSTANDVKAQMEA